MSTPKKVNLHSHMKGELKDRDKKPAQETLFDVPEKGYVMLPKKEAKETRGKLKNNFPLYMEKSSADKLLRLSRELGYTRNELIIDMINSCLRDAGIKWKVSAE